MTRDYNRDVDGEGKYGIDRGTGRQQVDGDPVDWVEWVPSGPVSRVCSAVTSRVGSADDCGRRWRRTGGRDVRDGSGPRFTNRKVHA